MISDTLLAACLLLFACSAHAQTIPQHQVNALFGAHGQIPAGSNPYATDKDPRVDPTTGSGTVGVKWNGTRIGQPTVLNFTGDVAVSMDGGTANILFPSSNNTATDPTGYTQILGGSQHLTVSCTTNSTVTIAADWLDIQGNFKTAALHPVALTAIITNSGAGGLDVGTVQPNSWYRLWVGTRLDGSDPVAFFTLAGPYYQNYTAGGPPSFTAYKLWRQVDWVLTDSSSHILPFLTIGRRHVVSHPGGGIVLPFPIYSPGVFSQILNFSSAPPIPSGRLYCVLRTQRNTGAPGTAYDPKIRTHGYSSMSVTVAKFDGNFPTPWTPISIPIALDRAFDLYANTNLNGSGVALNTGSLILQSFDTML